MSIVCPRCAAHAIVDLAKGCGDRDLDDELRGSAYVVVDGIDGHTHHIKLPDLDAAGDSAPGSIVELRTFEDARGERRLALATRSDLSIEAQTTASGATWLDRQLIARDPADLGGGFGLEVKQAMEARAQHLIQDGMARRDGERILFSRNLLGTLRQRELDALGDRLAAETGTLFQKSADGEYVVGVYRQRFALASGRFAMIDDGLGFKLVPWTPSIERHIGQHISGSPAPTAASTGRSAASGGWDCDGTGETLHFSAILLM